MRSRMAESGKWVRDTCRLERLRILEEKLQDALQKIDMLSRKNNTLEEKLRLATEGREEGNGDKVQCYTKGGEILVLGDSIIRNVGSNCPDM